MVIWCDLSEPGLKGLALVIPSASMKSGVLMLPTFNEMGIWSLETTQVTVAFMILVEQGRVRLDDSVAKFLPAFADVQADERAGSLQEIAWHVAVHYAKPRRVPHETTPC